MKWGSALEVCRMHIKGLFGIRLFAEIENFLLKVL